MDYYIVRRLTPSGDEIIYRGGDMCKAFGLIPTRKQGGHERYHLYLISEQCGELFLSHIENIGRGPDGVLDDIGKNSYIRIPLRGFKDFIDEARL